MAQDRQINPEWWYTFWDQFLTEWHKSSSLLFLNQQPMKNNYLLHPIGNGIDFVFCFDGNKYKHFCKSEFRIELSSVDETNSVFEFLQLQKQQIEQDFVGRLKWESAIAGKSSFARIFSELPGLAVGDQGNWKAMNDFMMDAMLRLESAFEKPIEQLKQKRQGV